MEQNQHTADGLRTWLRFINQHVDTCRVSEDPTCFSRGFDHRRQT